MAIDINPTQTVSYPSPSFTRNVDVIVNQRTNGRTHFRKIEFVKTVRDVLLSLLLIACQPL